MKLRLAELALLHVELYQGFLHIQTGGNGLESVIGMLDRSPEKGHDCISHVFINDPVALHDLVDHEGEVAVQGCNHLVCLHLLGDRGKAADIGEENRQDPILPDQQGFRILEKTIDHLIGNVLLEDTADFLLVFSGQNRPEGEVLDLVVGFVQLVDREVEGVGQCSELVPVLHADPFG